MKLGSFQIYLSREKWNRYFNNWAASKKRESSFSNYYYASIGRVGEASGELLWYGIVESFCARLVEQFPLSLSITVALHVPPLRSSMTRRLGLRTEITWRTTNLHTKTLTSISSFIIHIHQRFLSSEENDDDIWNVTTTITKSFQSSLQQPLDLQPFGLLS